MQQLLRIDVFMYISYSGIALVAIKGPVKQGLLQYCHATIVAKSSLYIVYF